MGFFDKMIAIFNEEKSFSAEELKWHFHREVQTIGHPDNDPEDNPSTNIGEIIWNRVRDRYPDAAFNTSKYYIVNDNGEVTKVDDTIYKIVYIGRINVKNRYDDSIGGLYFHVIVHTDKYAKISKDPEHKTTVTTSEKPVP